MRGSSAHGFSLIEVCITLTISVILLFALHSSTRSSIMTRRSAEREYQIHLTASELLSRLRRIPFGSATDPAATAGQLTELFDDDDDLGSATVNQLVHPPADPGHTFTMVTSDFAGTWTIRVTRDLNDDGDVNDQRENRPDLVRLSILLDDRRIVETMRAAEASATTIDTDAVYIREN
jgi:prepilin-type N-terminal cleavage/methylation domain-containing protein